MSTSKFNKLISGPAVALLVSVGLIATVARAMPTMVSQILQNENGRRPAWGLDRIDQREAALNDTYNYSLTGEGVSV